MSWKRNSVQAAAFLDRRALYRNSSSLEQAISANVAYVCATVVQLWALLRTTNSTASSRHPPQIPLLLAHQPFPPSLLFQQAWQFPNPANERNDLAPHLSWIPISAAIEVGPHVIFPACQIRSSARTCSTRLRTPPPRHSRASGRDWLSSPLCIRIWCTNNNRIEGTIPFSSED